MRLSDVTYAYLCRNLYLTMYHYYRLLLVCQPGGSRKTEYYVFGTIEEVKMALAEDLTSPYGAYHALYYGEDILLECWEDGKRKLIIDLHPFITYRLSDRPEPIKFHEPGDKPILDLHEDTSLEEKQRRYYKLCEGEIIATVEVSWENVPLSKLDGAPLPVGTAASFADGDVWDYGFHGEWDSYLDA
jgi:hypothetical protein